MILVVGANGMLGRDLMTLLGEQAHGLDLPEINITDFDSVERVLKEFQPKVVINCAAYTDVDGCETNKETAMEVNAEGVAYLAMSSRGIGARLVHISTDYLFDGSKIAPYVEHDAPHPLNVYGESKWAGEMNAVLNPDHLIVRTQWLYGLHGKNFVETMLRLATEKDSLTVVDDQVGSPTWTMDLARATMALLEHGCRGVYHGANSGSTSWYGFAQAIFEESGVAVKLSTMTTEQLQRPARRPLHSTLDCSKLEQDAGYSFQPWREALKQYLAARNQN